MFELILSTILREIIGCLYSIWWDKKSIDTQKNQWLNQWLAIDVKYGFLRERNKRKLLALEMDYLRMSAKVSRLQKIPNTAIRNKMQAEKSILRQNSKKAIEMVWRPPQNGR